ncbi:2-oxo acid dehydrogenase subunit E2 [Paenibacillus filicis]|uniref:2-oxo acid dehydrogenase subunit E2 n=1 Tax=Paenibacillus gyeongsangnamensis TaxID=3388067 RepID=A0ABT4Q8E8_9BACL|nr:2-oxo acid dehydrogenase subunit E2 [Paenibacillus filicis]MCZ8513154.1 2-oxo acid dehydrogenase subunit E2 [Paenibacillus filicis]
MKPSEEKPAIIALPKARRHTYYFLNYADEFKSVYLDTEIDMSEVKRRRDKLKLSGHRISYIVFLIEAISRVIRLYPEANSSVKHGMIPQMAVYHRIAAKFTLDKTMDGRRFVMSGIIPDSDQMPLEGMQKMIEYYRDTEADEITEFANVRKLQSMPLWLGRWIYRLAMGNLSRRAKLQGTFTITSLGHRPIQAFYPIISNTLCFGVGAIEDKPVVMAGQIAIRPMMKLSLAFDHRAIDGALAADILTEVKKVLEFASESDEASTQGEEVTPVGAST